MVEIYVLEIFDANSIKVVKHPMLELLVVQVHEVSMALVS